MAGCAKTSADSETTTQDIMLPIASTYAERSLYGFGTLQSYAANAKIKELGENKAPNLEKLVELEPDLIIYTAEARNLDMELYEAASRIAMGNFSREQILSIFNVLEAYFLDNVFNESIAASFIDKILSQAELVETN